MKSIAIFLDRDGTINYDTGYLGNPDDVKLYPGVSEGIKLLKNKYELKIIVISNQSGITRGLITVEDVEKVNKKINNILLRDNTFIDDFFYCPYHPDYDSPNKCKCRKPSAQMVFEAASKYMIDLEKSFFVGDKESDIECSKNAGTSSILLSTTMHEKEIIMLKNSKNSPNFIAYNFLDAVRFIQRHLDGEIVEN